MLTPARKVRLQPTLSLRFPVGSVLLVLTRVHVLGLIRGLSTFPENAGEFEQTYYGDFAQLPILMILNAIQTAYKSQRSREKCLGSWFRPFMPKPLIRVER